jgi:hypothetical protein
LKDGFGRDGLVTGAAFRIKELKKVAECIGVGGVMKKRALAANVDQIFRFEFLEMMGESRSGNAQLFLNFAGHKAPGMSREEQLHNAQTGLGAHGGKHFGELEDLFWGGGVFGLGHISIFAEIWDRVKFSAFGLFRVPRSPRGVPHRNELGTFVCFGHQKVDRGARYGPYFGWKAILSLQVGALEWTVRPKVFSGGRFKKCLAKEDVMRPYRDIATLAGAQILCFLVLTHFEPGFFLLHFYQSVLYIAILIMLFYMEDRWAYMIAILASAVWLGMAYATGMLGSAVEQLAHVRGSSETAVGALTMFTALIAVLMIAVCGRHWQKEYSGLGKTTRTFAWSFGVVAVYYGVLIAWFWNMFPKT